MDNKQYLFHATFRHNLESILQNGLTGYTDHLWGDSRDGVIYLATDEDIAISFVEAAVGELDLGVDEDDITVLKIDINGLNLENLYIDNNIIFDEDEEIYSYEYHGDIPPEFLTLK